MNKHLESGRTAQKQQTRRKILLAANQLLEKGIGLSMEAIAKEAAISRATIYRYYSSIDSLATELILQLNVPTQPQIDKVVTGKNLKADLTNIQEIYLNFILENEVASRKFLGAVLSSADPKLERGKNRLHALTHYFEQFPSSFAAKDHQNLINVSVLLMGIESIIVSKDVCGLEADEAKNALRWGLEMILKGLQTP